MVAMGLPQDFADLLSAFAEASVRYLLIGGYAVGIHDRPRTTKALDILLDPDPENLKRACVALEHFGAPSSIRDSLAGATPSEIVWWGQAPLRIDLLQAAPGIDFPRAYSRRVRIPLGEITADVISLDDLITAKEAAGRPQDLVDAGRLRRRLRKP